MSGFLVEAFTHLGQQVKTVADQKTLQEKSLSGCEAKPLPYLLCQMNLLLHGLDAPQIDARNALRQYQRVLPAKHYKIIETRLTLAADLESQAQYSEAQREFSTALNEARATQPSPACPPSQPLIPLRAGARTQPPRGSR